jgi:hypothetical protein
LGVDLRDIFEFDKVKKYKNQRILTATRVAQGCSRPKGNFQPKATFGQGGSPSEAALWADPWRLKGGFA